MTTERALERLNKKPEERKERVPVSAGRSPLKYNYQETDKYRYRWVLDKDDRIAAFLEGGYEFSPPNGRPVGDPTVNSQSQDGNRVRKSAAFGGLFLYLMRIPIEWYEQDQALKLLEVDETETSMQQPGTGRAIGKDVDYGKISLKRNKNQEDD